MDHNSKEFSIDARAKCCTPGYTIVKKRAPRLDGELEEALEIFLDSPQYVNETQSDHFEAQEVVISRLPGMLFGNVSLDTVTTWNTMTGNKYKNLNYDNLTECLESDDYALECGNDKLAEDIVCQLDRFSMRLSDDEEVLTYYKGKSNSPLDKRFVPDGGWSLIDVSIGQGTSPNPRHGLQKRAEVNMASQNSPPF
ncbi:hypothetical protein ACJZ2D_004125 [Fusarium nematophilum]